MRIAILAPRGGGVEEVTGVLFAPAEPGSVAVVTAGEIDPGATYRLDGEWTARPVPPAPPSMTAGVEAVWSGLPVGAVVTVDPLNGAAPVTGTAEDGTLALTLPAGPWRLSVAEVFPAVAVSYDVEVLEP